uniref:Secretagogin n=1 Tax=Taeniopygia guttata TaxID=59729 RepID=H0ZF19_TAEGU
MESGADGRLDAAAFLGAWRRFDADDNGYIEGKELDDFFHHLLEKLGPESTITEEEVQRMKEQFMSVYDVTTDGRLQIQELANMILPDDENFLLLFRRETPLDNSVEFMRIWRSYDADSSGFISAGELKDFLRDLFLQHNKMVAEVKLEEYTDTMMKIFDKNKDGRLDLNDLARILALQENFLLQFKMDACSTEERRRDFEKIFAHYDVVQACQQGRGDLPSTANAPGMECQASRPAQQARGAACLRFRFPGIFWHFLAFPGMGSCLHFLAALPKVSKLKSSLDAYLRLVKSCWELISVWDFCGLEGVVCDYFVLFLPGKTALPLPRKKLGKVPLTHI